MAEIEHAGVPSRSGEPEKQGDRAGGLHTRLIAWLAMSAGFLGYLTFGSVEARIWKFGQLYFEDRRITYVWSYFGRHLPEMPAQSLISVLYYLSIAIMIAGTIGGLWYFLREEPESSSSPHSLGPGSSPVDHV